MAKESNITDQLPVYIPWKTFANYIDGLKKTTVPHTLDNSTRPATMSGGLWRQLISSLKFLKLIESDGKATENLSKLVKANGKPAWKDAVKTHVVLPYQDIVGGLPLKNATAAQLDKKFRDNGKVDGQMLQKCERFYLHALREAEMEYSSLFSLRRESKSTNGSRRKKKPPANKSRKNANKKFDSKQQEEIDFQQPKGTIQYRLYFKGKPEGALIVPEDLNPADCKVIELQVQVLRAYAGEDK